MVEVYCSIHCPSLPPNKGPKIDPYKGDGKNGMSQGDSISDSRIYNTSEEPPIEPRSTQLTPEATLIAKDYQLRTFFKRNGILYRRDGCS